MGPFCIQLFAAGILGGISTGEPIGDPACGGEAYGVPSPRSNKPGTSNEHDENVEIEVLGRHDPCIVPRAVPVIEAMAALVVLDAWEVQRRLNADWAAKHPL